MKLHYSKILLFALPLNILVTSSSNVYNKNKPYITPHHTAIYTSRVLSEGDIQLSSYDKDADMKSVKENFDRQSSQRFQEYEDRVKDKRQKRKEESDKNIQSIIEKDKMEKSLEEKIEKCCLRCGCGLGGVAASVGLFGGLGTYGWKNAAIVAAAKEAGEAAGVQTLINKLKVYLGIKDFYSTSLAKFITTDNYCNATVISERVKVFYESLSQEELTFDKYPLFSTYKNMSGDEGTRIVVESTKTFVEEAVKEASEETIRFTATETAVAKAGKLAEIAETSTYAYSAIGYSVLAILIIVLVMIIIYLVLRYRRKKKMNKKAQYTKLLNE
ncbi:rifin PIR protein, putative [Plasmodium reichenowi]|uniref:Rifin PIR protein, putative n=1 Tax=Plasmodium reichenowi TaxID=5854 RepID=A0A2P9D4A5_PLARE|nr:rifin PIR protein, putative [Plasmodium reichenowi]